MLFYGIRSLPRRFLLLLVSLQQSDSLPFSEALDLEQIETTCQTHGVSFDDDDTVFTPAVTLWAFLSQALHKGEMRSCLAAVARVGVLLVAMGRPRCAQNNGAYCKARSRFPLAVLEELAVEVAQRCEAEVPEEWLWIGHHVKLVDGTTVTMPDTEENQEEFPQQSCQKEGLGYPIARMVVILSLATAMVTAMAMGRYQGKETGELALLRKLLDHFAPNDIFLADKLYCSYFMIALLMQRPIDLVVLLHQSRKVDLRRGKRLGEGDYLITWHRPTRPSWMDQATYEQMPKTLEVRLVKVKISEPGFRTRSLDIVTTLSDAEKYTPDDLAQLYRRRWLAELDIRSIKETMGMNELRCQSPEMVRKEIWVCLLAYNLIRQKMLQAASEEGTSPRQLSFANALQTIAAGWMVMPLLNRATQQVLINFELASIARQKVGKRPGRVEPRAVKRRPKAYRLLTMVRDQARALLLKGIDPYKKQKKAS